MLNLIHFKDTKVIEHIEVQDIYDEKSNIVPHAKHYVVYDNHATEQIMGKDQICFACYYCAKNKILKFSYALRYGYLTNKKYICQSCNKAGSKNPFFGKKNSDSTKEKISKANKGHKRWLGKKHSTETCKKISKSVSTSITGKGNPMYGKSVYDVWVDKYGKEEADKKQTRTVEKIKSTHAGKSQEEKDMISRKIKERQLANRNKDPINYRTSKQKAAYASLYANSKFKKNRIEKIVENYLIEHNIPYQYSIIMSKFQFDFLIENRIVIEVHGDYWHANPKFFNLMGTDGKRKLNKMQLSKIERDVIKSQFLLDHDFKLLCLWEDQILNGEFMRLIDNFLKGDNS